MSNHSSEVRELWQWLIRTEALSIPLGKVHNLPELSLRTTTLQWTQPRLSRVLLHNNLQLYETKIWWLLQLLIRLNSLLYNTKPTAICRVLPRLMPNTWISPWWCEQQQKRLCGWKHRSVTLTRDFWLKGDVGPGDVWHTFLSFPCSLIRWAWMCTHLQRQSSW